MPTHNLNGADLYYKVTGAGPWLVFAHGGEGTRLHWWAQVAALQHRFRCVTYDARGFGQSTVGAMQTAVYNAVLARFLSPQS